MLRQHNPSPILTSLVNTKITLKLDLNYNVILNQKGSEACVTVYCVTFLPPAKECLKERPETTAEAGVNLMMRSALTDLMLHLCVYMMSIFQPLCYLRPLHTKHTALKKI